MDLSDLNLSQEFGPLQKLPIVRLAKKRKKFGESGEYSTIDRVLKQVVEDAYRYAKDLTPIKQPKKSLPTPDPSKYNSFNRLKGPTINKLAEMILLEPDLPKAKPKPKTRILPQWIGGIYNESQEPCKIYSHTDVPGCSSAAVASEELCLFCNDQKDDSLNETEENYAFRNNMAYGTSDGSILNTLPAACKQDWNPKRFVVKESFTDIKMTVKTRARSKRQHVMPQLEFEEEIKMGDFMLPTSIFGDLGLPVPEDVKAHWNKNNNEADVKHTTTEKVEENLYPTPSLTASEMSEYKSEDVSMTEVETESTLTPLASSSPLPIEQQMTETVTEEPPPKPVVIGSPEELVQELKKCYRGIPPAKIRAFHSDFMERLRKLRDGLLEQRESELAAASVCLQDAEDVDEETDEPIDEPMELQQDAAASTNDPISDTEPQHVRLLSGISDTTEEDLEEFAEFFPDYPSRISSGADFVDSPLAVSRKSPEEVIDVVGVEEPSTSTKMERCDGFLNPNFVELEESRPNWYSDSEPSTSFNGSPESENNLTIEVVSPVKAAESWKQEAKSDIIMRSAYSSDDELYGKYPYDERFSPVTDGGVMQSPIASQQ